MRKLFLASSIADSGGHIAKKIKAGKAAFIYTAGEIEKDKTWIDEDRRGFNKLGIKTVFDYTISNKKPAELQKDLGDCDLIHVNGGNAFYLLLQAKKSGFDKFIRRQVQKGVIYIGSSAGSMIAAPDIAITKRLENIKYLKFLPDTRGFNLVDFVIFPHWGSPHFKTVFFSQRLKNSYKKGNKIILLNDDQYMEVINGNYKIVDITCDKIA